MGGGGTANSLAEIPSKITNLINTRKRVTELNVTILKDVHPADNYNKLYSANLNISFEPRYYLFKIYNGNSNIIVQLKSGLNNVTYGPNGRMTINVTTLNKSKIELKITSASTSGYYVTINGVIAIDK